MQFLDEHPEFLATAVFFARVADVSLGTLRTILVFRAFRVRAALIGFVETLIWVGAAGMVLRDLAAWHVAVAYAAGFATGNYVGIWLESKLAMGMELLRIISSNPDIALAANLRAHGFSITELDGHGDEGEEVEVMLVVEERRRLPSLLRLIDQTDPSAIYTLSDVKRHRATALAMPRVVPLFNKRK